jgi:hypothetical protein
MKKAVSLLMVFGFLVLTYGSVFAAWFDKGKAPQAPAVSQSRPVSQAAEVVAKKKAELNGTEWNIELWSMAKPKGKSKGEIDVISFAENKVASKNLSALGYAASGFSVRLEEDGTVIWETMQVSEKSGTAFWRGDIGPDGTMRGVLSRRDAKGNTVDSNFVSVPK